MIRNKQRTVVLLIRQFYIAYVPLSCPTWRFVDQAGYIDGSGGEDATGRLGEIARLLQLTVTFAAQVLRYSWHNLFFNTTVNDIYGKGSNDG